MVNRAALFNGFFKITADLFCKIKGIKKRANVLCFEIAYYHLFLSF